jgi:hypothetical protein
MATAKFTGQLYQLSSKYQLSRGSYVAINGPWDTYGVVLSSALQEDGRYLNQVRGVKARADEKTVASF